jgi:dipeptidyl aminopeptidase/acylaminoacyl peptidase
MRTTPRLILGVAALCLVLLGGCSTAPTHPSLRDDARGLITPTPLVPVRHYVASWGGNGGHQISPDGQHLMWVARLGLGPGVFVKNLQTGVVHSYDFQIPGQWAKDSRHLLFVGSNGNENDHVFELDALTEGAKLKDLTPFAGSKSFIHSQIEGSRDLLIANNQRNAKVFDLYRYEQASGKLNLLAENPGSVMQWHTNKAGLVIGRMRKAAEQWVHETPSDSSNTVWREAFRVADQDMVRPLTYAADKHFLWALSNQGRDKLALVKVDLRNGVEQVVFADPRVDVSHALMSDKTGEPLAVSLDPDFQEWKFFDARLQAAADSLRGSAASRLSITSVSDDENLIVASLLGDTGGKTVLYNLTSRQTTLLGEHSRSRIHAMSPLPQTQALHIKSRDGLDLQGYVTLPTGSKGVKPLPTVVYVHGGPWSRDVAFDYDPMPSFLANRGYAVLQVNFRGSSGFGRAFMEAAKGEFAGKMHTDLLDGLDHLEARGVTDPGKVAIMGASYGGYASMVGMTFTPERFSCGISMVGMSDLAGLIENAPPYWDLDLPRWITYVGDPAKPEERAVMDAKSPLFYANQVKGPMMMVHGGRDVRVKIDQSTRFVAALKKAGKPVDFYVYPNAGHGLHRWPDLLDHYRKTEDFLASCLGGRSSGFDFFQLASWAL